MCVAFDGDAECTAKTQVGNLAAHDAVINQQVLGLQVSVHDTVLVAVREALDQLVHEALQAHKRM